ncbi:hypothetical protein AVEN_187863-1 [Araneus ventricosus]|uniref:Uncharacterized protein n=1 Tax=Araneus ventricosus TaxID=182803 RepID=A0A4Y2CSC5_ARAVE|nr:hypothetical protein AVEN_187863-1 [Araneus ventricosus]
MALRLSSEQHRLERIERDLSTKLTSYAHFRQYIAYLSTCEPSEKTECLIDQAYYRLNELKRTIPENEGKWHALKYNVDELRNFLFNNDDTCVDITYDDNSKSVSAITSVCTPHANCDRTSCCDDSDSDMSPNNESSEEIQISDDIVNNSVLPINSYLNINNLDTSNVNSLNEMPAKPNGHVALSNDKNKLIPTERPVIGPLPAVEKVITKKNSKKLKSKNGKDVTRETVDSVSNVNHTSEVVPRNKLAPKINSDLINNSETETNSKTETYPETGTSGSKLFCKPTEGANEDDGCVIMEEPTPNANVEFLKAPHKDNFVKQRKRSRKHSGNSEGPSKKSQTGGLALHFQYIFYFQFRFYR